MNSPLKISRFILPLLIAILILVAGVWWFASGQGSNSSKGPQQSSTSKVSSQQKSSNQSSSSTSTDESSQSSSSDAAHWNTDKAKKLADFMVEWGQAMNQPNYVRLDASSEQQNGDIGQISFVNSNRVAVNDVQVNVEWSADGKGQADYQIVDAYIYWADNAVSPIFYLFTLHNGQAQVLVSQQNQGNDENLLYTYPTDNVELQNGFASIIND